MIVAILTAVAVWMIFVAAMLGVIAIELASLNDTIAGKRAARPVAPSGPRLATIDGRPAA